MSKGDIVSYCVHLVPDVDATRAGAKAANLGRALSLGLRVPPAFVVTRGALCLFLSEAGLMERVRAFLGNDGSPDRDARRQAFEELCSAVLEAPIPETLEREVSELAGNLLKTVVVLDTE